MKRLLEFFKRRRKVVPRPATGPAIARATVDDDVMPMGIMNPANPLSPLSPLNPLNSVLSSPAPAAAAVTEPFRMIEHPARAELPPDSPVSTDLHPTPVHAYSVDAGASSYDGGSSGYDSGSSSGGYDGGSSDGGSSSSGSD